MAITQTDIDNLNAAIAKGEQIVRVGTRMVQYRTTGDLIKARDDLQRHLAEANTAKPQRVFTLSHGGRGYD